MAPYLPVEGVQCCIDPFPDHFPPIKVACRPCDPLPTAKVARDSVDPLPVLDFPAWTHRPLTRYLQSCRRTIVMADPAQFKNKRSTIRGRLTRILKVVDKLLEEELQDLDSHDLRIQLTTIEELAKEHRQASAAYCEALTTAGTSDADLEKEIEANADKEALYESYINTISRTLRQQAVLTSYERIMTSLETWLATTTDYLTEGRTISKELDQVVSQMRSLRKIPVFQSLLDKAVGGLEEVRTHLLKSPSPAVPRIEAAAVPVTTAKSHATILQLKPPTFSGEIRDFHGFDQ